jgi:hypothetical protein
MEVVGGAEEKGREPSPEEKENKTTIPPPAHPGGVLVQPPFSWAIWKSCKS